MFFDRGYESTSIRDLAAALDIKAASLYYHFPDKEQILYELVASVLDQLLEGARSSWPGARTAPRAASWPRSSSTTSCCTRCARRRRRSGDSELRSLTGERRERQHPHPRRLRAARDRRARGGPEAGAFDIIDIKLTAYAIIAQASHVGTWYQPDGRLSLEEVTAVLRRRSRCAWSPPSRWRPPTSSASSSEPRAFQRPAVSSPRRRRVASASTSSPREHDAVDRSRALAPRPSPRARRASTSAGSRSSGSP